MMAHRMRIIFVDDEPNVLSGLRRMLRPMRGEWEMEFAAGGAEALEVMSRQRFDVLVTDMRMPGMSGDELLSEVQSRFPTTVRIVLSGQVEQGGVLENLGPIHQFLQKPCDAEILKAAISRLSGLGELFAEGELKAMITELESLPPCSAVHEELLAKLRTPGVSPRLVGETIARDVAMTAKIVQLVNSSFFGVRRKVVSPADAVTLLGLETVKSLVLTMHVFARIGGGEAEGFSQEALFRHSSDVAALSRAIASAQDLPAPAVEDCYMAGLLHDIGKLICAAKRADAFAAAAALARAEGIATTEAERRTIGASHAEIGAYLLGLWGFSTPIVDAAAFHHGPGRSRLGGFTALTAVHVADAVVRAGEAEEPAVDLEYLRGIGCADRLKDWCGMHPCAA